jgi:hypothetical protein
VLVVAKMLKQFVLNIFKFAALLAGVMIIVHEAVCIYEVHYIS